LARHICSNCGTAVADEDFCPKCGAWIDPLARKDGGEYEEFELGEEPADGNNRPQVHQVPRQEVQCPSCGSSNSAANRHCEECGARLHQASLPVAPRPAVQTTAGVRAAIVISSVLAAVVLIALIVNAFGGDEPAATTVAGNGTTVVSAPGTEPDPAPIPVIRVTCDPEGIPGFPCDNLIDGAPTEYQVNYEELSAAGGEIVIKFSFAQPMQITRILWENITDEARFRRNYRVKSVNVKTEDSNLEVPLPLEDDSGLQDHRYETFLSGTTTVSLTVRTVFPSEVVDGQEPFNELAIEEITFVGYQASEVAPPTSSSTTAP
jgi:hypothetical protein